MANIVTLPGLIDPHVHLRTPGQTHKEDFMTGTAAAVAGGFTTVLDMPNNAQPIMSLALLEEKRKIASETAVSDIGFYFTSNGENLEEFEKVKDKIVGLKLFLNHTTGNLMIEDESIIEQIIAAWPQEKPIVAHAEDEKVNLLVNFVRKHGRRLHICHLSSKGELQTVLDAKKEGLPVTCGVTPHHLFLTANDVETLGAFAMMKPALESQEDVDFLWAHIKDIDMIESDHAPHTVEEKQGHPTPFGVPGLETTLGLLLTAMQEENKLTLDDIKRLCYETPAKIFGITQDAETKIEIDLDEQWQVENEKLFTKCKWSPYSGWKLHGKVKRTFIRGTKVYEDGKILVAPGFGKVLP